MRTGTHSAWFGGYDVAEIGTLSQSVTIPDGSAKLTFYIAIVGATPSPGDTFRALIDGEEVFSTTAATPTNSFARHVVDISEFADGNQHLLEFIGEFSGTPVSSFFMDDVTITCTDPAIVFDFEFNDEGWMFISIPGYSVATGNADNGRLSIQVNDNTNSFAIWESPVLNFGDSDRGPVAGPQLAKGTFMVASSESDQSIVPTFRLRTSDSDFARSDVQAISARSGATLSPDTNTKEYTHYFQIPTSDSGFRADIDVLNFNPANAAPSTLFLDQLKLETIDQDFSAATTVFSQDFRNSNANGWTTRFAEPLGIPQFASTADGLLIRGSDSRGIASSTFGFWGFESDVPIEGDSLYRVSFTITTDATPEEVAGIAAYRLRINDSSLVFSASVNVESSASVPDLPAQGTSRNYEIIFATPSEIAGSNFIFSSDYIYVPATLNDPTIAVILQDLKVEKLAVK